MKECPACNRCFPDSLNHCPTDGDALRFTITGDTVLDGRYQLERRLGAGGMGCVYKGRHVFLKTSHAIKVILPDLVGNDPSLVTRFRQEAMAAAAIRHQNIINVTDFGVVNNAMPFLVMEFLEGCSLHDLLVAEKRLSPARALEIMLAVASGVGAAHRQGIVHRDLKPLNIMLKGDCSAREGVKVLDFGLAKIKSGELLGSFVAAQTQGLMGSPFYMAPEQWGDEEPDARSDIYALGVILYQMLAGEVPFRGNSVPSIMKKHLHDPPPPLAEKGVEVPAEVERLVYRALEKVPDARQQSIDEFAEDLRAALDALGPQPVGLHTSPDVGLKTVAIEETSTPPRAEPVAATTDANGEPGVGMRTVPDASLQSAPEGSLGTAPDESLRPSTDASLRPAQTPPPVTGLETHALIGEPRRETTPPARETDEGHATGRAAQGATGLMDDEAEGEKAPAPTSFPPPPATVEGHETPESRGATFGAAPKQTQPLAPNQQTLHTPAQPSQPPAHLHAHTQAQAGAPRQLASPAAAQPAPPAAEAQVPRPRFAPTPAAAPSVAEGVRVPSRLPVAVWAAAGVLALLCVVAGLYVLFLRPSASETNANTAANTAANTGTVANVAPRNDNAPPASNTNAGPPPFKPELVSLPASSFPVGRNDVPPRSASVSLAYQAWTYNQWPAHNVQLAPFSIDRTEVTNAEYAEFVERAGYPAPPDWDGKRPPAGQEAWPVRNVSLEDAERFARWRSQRDGVQYRLPTEAEWEYAARGGDPNRLFPWGREWAEGRANLESDSLKPVGSYPNGATPQGAHDMIGNVWEWTSTPAAMYRGNDQLMLAPGDTGKIVVRGGSFQSKARGDEPVTATARRWVARDRKDPVIGFRLVRPGR